MKKADPFYLTTKWRKIRSRVVKKYHGTCQHCEAAGNEVHHIIPREDDPTKELDFDNLILLCRSCHNRVHSRMDGTLREPPPQIGLDGFPLGW